MIKDLDATADEINTVETLADLPSSAIEQIRENPTARAWAEEFDCIFEMLREKEIGELGDVYKHINVIINGAQNPGLARKTFLTALGELLQSWQPAIYETPARLYYTLSLIKGFTPKIGFVKLAGYLKDELFYGQFETPMGWATNLQLLAFKALEKYYPVAPPGASDDESYQAYLDILKKYFTVQEYLGYCAARLIDLKIFSSKTPEILVGIKRYPAAFKEILQVLFKQSDLSVLSNDLADLYLYSKENKLLDKFKIYLEPYGELIEQPLTQVEHPDSRIDQHRYPSIYFSHADGLTTLQLPLTAEETFWIHDQTGLSLSDLKELIESYKSSNRELKENLKKEIAEELSGLIEKALISQHYNLEDVLQQIKAFGGDVSTDDSGFSFNLNGQLVAPLNIISEPEVWSKLQKHKESTNDFWKLTSEARRPSSRNVNH